MHDTLSPLRYPEAGRGPAVTSAARDLRLHRGRDHGRPAAWQAWGMARLDGKAALVTGGSRGIGRAIAERLAAEGAQVVLSYAAHKDAADDAVAAIAAAGGRGHAVPADLREPDAARLLFERAEAIAGPLDILINNAAIGTTGLIAETSEDRKSTRLNSSHPSISYAVFCLKKKKKST